MLGFLLVLQDQYVMRHDKQLHINLRHCYQAARSKRLLSGVGCIISPGLLSTEAQHGKGLRLLLQHAGGELLSEEQLMREVKDLKPGQAEEQQQLLVLVAMVEGSGGDKAGEAGRAGREEVVVGKDTAWAEQMLPQGFRCYSREWLVESLLVQQCSWENAAYVVS
jgi:hypothetical protein